MKKLLCLVLAALLLLPAMVLSSCSDKNTETPQTSAPAGDNTGEVPDPDVTTEVVFREADYNDEDFTVYFRNQNAEHYRGMYIIPKDESTDVVDAAAVRRNQMVEEKYKIKFVAKEASRPSNSVAKDISNGALVYDVVLDQRNYLESLATAGNLYDFKKLDVDYTTHWWDSNCAANYTIFNKLFFMVNDTSVSNIAGIRFYYFNKQVLEDFRLKSPYDYAAENKWTLDNFLNMVKSVSAPGTDGEYGVYGLCSEGNPFIRFNLNGVGIAQSELGPNGEIVCNLLEKNSIERSEQFFEKFMPVHNDKNCCLLFGEAAAKDSVNASKYADTFVQTRHLFSEGKFLFTQSTMNGTVDFGDMEKGYGVVMNPKFNEDQERYYHPVDDNANIWVIPNSADIDFERLAVIMDYWAYASSKTVMESYYELTMKTKRATDPTTAGMLDTIKATAVYYPTDIYKVSDISDLLGVAMVNGFAKPAAKYSKSLPNALKKLNSAISAIQ